MSRLPLYVNLLIAILELGFVILFFSVDPVQGGFIQHFLANHSLTQDKDHLKGHLGFDVDDMTAHQLRFGYFRSHDTNGDGGLDGLELLQAFLHSVHPSEGPSDGASFTDESLGKVIDSLLETMDKDGNGFVNYAEFCAAQGEAKNHFQDIVIDVDDGLQSPA